MFEFLKNLILENLDTVPEDAKAAYAKGADGKYHLLPVVKSLAEAHFGVNTSLTNVRNDLTKSNKEAADRRAALKTFEDMASALGVEVKDGDLGAAFKGMIDDLVGKAKNGAEVKVNMDKLRGEFEKQIAGIKATSDGEVNGMRSALEKYLIENAALGALSTEKGNAMLLLPHIKSRTKVVKDGDNYVVRIVDASGDARGDGRGGWLGVADLVKEMRADTNFAMAFESTTRSGGGANPGATTTTTTKPTTGAEGDGDALSNIKAGLAGGQYQGAGAGKNA